MRLEPYACLNGVEISNGYRVATYVETGLPSTATMPVDCQCVHLDGDFVDPTDAPWYESTRPESADFLGFYANNITLNPVTDRRTEKVGRFGSSLGKLGFTGRSVQVRGLMLARSMEGQAYGERWLTEALRGSPCTGDCTGSDLTLLTACPDDYDISQYYRTLVDVGLVDGPVYAQIQELPECYLQQANFVLTSSQPYLFHPATRCLDEESLIVEQACSLTTPSWMGEGTFRIELDNPQTFAATDITITGQISLDGDCPVEAPASSVPPTFVYEIPRLEAEDKLVIDGARRTVQRYDASLKTWLPGYLSVDFSGPWKWPDVLACTTMCLTISSAGAPTITVDSFLREL